jgi:hypothetical protein
MRLTYNGGTMNGSNGQCRGYKYGKRTIEGLQMRLYGEIWNNIEKTYVMCHDLFYVQWIEAKGGCLFWWYFWKLSTITVTGFLNSWISLPTITMNIGTPRMKVISQYLQSSASASVLNSILTTPEYRNKIYFQTIHWWWHASKCCINISLFFKQLMIISAWFNCTFATGQN